MIVVGAYSIEVIYDCTALPCSPFVSRAYDASAITCGPIPLGFVDKPVEFNGTWRGARLQPLLKFLTFKYFEQCSRAAGSID